MRSRFLRTGALAIAVAALASLLMPGAAFAQADVLEQVEAKAAELDMVWVAVATILVFLMQAGFMFLEIGFSRQKNAGTGVAKIFINLAVVTIAWWAIGYGVNGSGNDFFGNDGFFFHFGQTIGSGAEATVVTADDTMMMLFGLAFCAVSLAIVWGTTLERIKFGAYVIYAIVFGALIYPLVAHSVWGGGLLSDVGGKPVMDFAGSSVVHLTGAVGGARGAAAARRSQGQVRPRRQAAGDPRPLDAAGRPRRGDPVDRLVRLQRRLDVRDRRLVLRRGHAEHPARGRGRRHRRQHRRLLEDEVARRRHGRQRRDRRPGRHHGPGRVRRVLGGADHRPDRRLHRRLRRPGRSR